jgi:hypothetical protein
MPSSARAWREVIKKIIYKMILGKEYIMTVIC